MYFTQFPIIRYSLDDGDTSFIITDFFRRVKANQNTIINSSAYDEYDIRENETPEILADRIYGDCRLHWIILIINDIIDPRWDWPMDTDVFINYLDEKYGLGNSNDVHHYINTDGDIVHSSYSGTKEAVTNYEYELDLNEAKRRIKILKPKFVPQFIATFQKTIITR